MSFIEINLRSNLKEVSASLDAFARKQLPFATSLMLNSLAKKAQAAETVNFSKVFDKPTPFTNRAIGVIRSNKNNLTATIFVKDIQAVYLAPYAFGGKQVPHKQAMLVPKNIAVNQYGNLPQKKLQQLKGKGNVFTGAIFTKSGQRVAGIWQRPTGRGKNTHLKLLVRFSDPQTVKQHLDWGKATAEVVNKNYNLEMQLALNRALASAK